MNAAGTQLFFRNLAKACPIDERGTGDHHLRRIFNNNGIMGRGDSCRADTGNTAQGQ